MNSASDFSHARNDHKSPRGGRPRHKRLDVWVTPEDHAMLLDKAQQCGMPASTYMRNVGLNLPVKSILDYKSVVELLRLKGDMGRLGGLLKLWLSERRGEGSAVTDVNRVLREIREIELEILKKIRQV